MKLLLLLIALLIGQVPAQFASAQESEVTSQSALQVAPEIIEIRKSLPMEPTEKSVKDFIINRGASAGLRAGAYVNVVREVTVNDPVRNKALGSLRIPVGKLQLIHVEDGISVARLHSELGDDERPMLEYEALMIGDEVDLKSISMDSPKASKRKWSTAATEETTKAAEGAPVQPEQKATELATVNTPPAEPVVTAPTKTEASNEPAFIITPIESEQDMPVKEKTSFIPSESATVTAATTAN